MATSSVTSPQQDRQNTDSVLLPEAFFMCDMKLHCHYGRYNVPSDLYLYPGDGNWYCEQCLPCLPAETQSLRTYISENPDQLVENILDN